MVGESFNRWTVINDKPINRKLLCRCVCGNEKLVDIYSLPSGKSKSCGCLNKELTSQRFKKHGYDRDDRLYSIWANMKSRCNSVNTPYYHNYGGRGISVCDEWSENHLAFREWALKNGYHNNLSIDRINTNGDYEPSNCRWVTKEVQDNNKRTNIFFVVDGEEITMKELSRRSNIPNTTLLYRYRRGFKTYEEIIKPRRGSSCTN